MIMKFVLVVVLAGITGIAGWWTMYLRERVMEHELELRARDVRIEALVQDVEQKGRRILELEFRLRLHKVDHRLARIEVISQEPIPGREGVVETTLRFIELGADGEPLGEGQVITVEGTTLYLESLVIKFDDQHVEDGDFLRGTSVCLFTRMFSEATAPDQGVPIETTGARPYSYGSGGDREEDLFHAELWERFWEYADDPEAAEAKGVRALHGESPFIRARPGRSYRVELRASGGLTIKPE